jgi:hypothetical protein
MAEIRLGRAEVEKGRLPKVCMVCGSRASVKRKKSFSWYPSWAGLVGGFILAMIMSKRMTINAPLCRQHRNHWLVRTLLISLGFVGVFVLTGFLLFVAAVKSGANGGSDKPLLAVLAFGGILLVAWLIMTIVLQHTAIRAKEITDNSMTLINVNKSFLSALKDLREERREQKEEMARPARRRPRLDEEEDD